jgi:Pirin-related protein
MGPCDTDGTLANSKGNTMKKIRKTVTGHPAIDGAGVHLVRVLGGRTVTDFDPFLMLDSFDSSNPEDYIKGFPMHPHRGIETITYLVEGEIQHQDSLGNKGSILSGQAQWMTAGSGILHQEMPQAAKRMLGLQIWLNLPRSEKMTDPAYFGITREMVPTVAEGGATVRVISGSYKTTHGITPKHIQATMYDVSLEANEAINLETRPGENVFVFLLLGGSIIDERNIAEKTAVLFGEGDGIRIAATKDAPVRFIFFSGKPLGEPVAWGGPIVMNTEEELATAFNELESGRFIKHAPAM